MPLFYGRPRGLVDGPHERRAIAASCLAPRRALSSRTPTNRCRSGAAGRQVRARESSPEVVALPPALESPCALRLAVGRAGRVALIAYGYQQSMRRCCLATNAVAGTADARAASDARAWRECACVVGARPPAPLALSGDSRPAPICGRRCAVCERLDRPGSFAVEGS